MKKTNIFNMVLLLIVASIVLTVCGGQVATSAQAPA